MALIRAKDTKPELAIRRALHRLGYRFRHGHRCLKGRVPAGNRAYWSQKISGNKTRDRRNSRRLRAMGWKVKTIWECDVRRQSREQLAASLRRLFASI
jgi:DNA mismatch endonuclease (patch repair protein)